MKQLSFSSLCILFLSLNLYAQSVAVNTTGDPADTSAMMDVQSTTKGMLIPRMTTIQRELITGPAVGLLIFDTDTESFWFKETVGWVELRDGNIKSLADDDDDTKIQVEESADEDVIRFDLAGQEMWMMEGRRLEALNTGRSLFIGDEAGKNDDGTDNQNIAFGDSALYTTITGHDNIAIGFRSLQSNTIGSSNVAIGQNTLRSSWSGFFNTATGESALSANLEGDQNTAIGYHAMSANTYGSYNTAVGSNALYYNSTGADNTAIGTGALTSSMTGQSNTAVGREAMWGNNAGSWNTAIGKYALFANHEGLRNTVVGYAALKSNTSGSNNVAIGNAALTQSDSLSNLVAVGDSALFNNGVGGSSMDATFNTAIGSKSQFSNATGRQNTSVGYRSLYLNSSGDYNTAVGYQALYGNISGDENTALGLAAGYNNTGSGNIFLGKDAGYNETGSNKLYIDNSNTVSPLIYGEFDTDILGLNAAVGIGTNSPDELLHVYNAAGNASILVNSADGDSASVQMYEGSGFGFEFQYDGIGDQLNLWSRKFNGNEAIRMTWEKNGLVGIGNTAPLYNLHVGNGNISATNGSNTRMVVSDNDNGQRAAILGLAKTSGGAKVEVQLEANGSNTSGPSVIMGASTSHPLYIRTGNLTRMTVTTSGSVGIGTTSPATKLDVNGDITVDNEINASPTGLANMIPLAYGYVASDGTIISGTGNFTISHTGTGVYEIDVSNFTSTVENSIIIANGTTINRSISAVTVAGVDFAVVSETLGGTLADTNFMFVIYAY